jgi:hypothetical protein
MGDDFYIIDTAGINYFHQKRDGPAARSWTLYPNNFTNQNLLVPMPIITISKNDSGGISVNFSQPNKTENFPIKYVGNGEYIVNETFKIISPDGLSEDIYILNYQEIDKTLNITVNISVTIKRPKNFGEEKIIKNNSSSVFIENTDIYVPILDISSQTLIDGSDVGQTIFTIQDKFQYYDNIPSEFNKCGIYKINPDQLKTTIFGKSCPKIVSVVIGDEDTWYNKTESIFTRLGQEKIGADFGNFRRRMLFYAMLKYILSRILYGKFNVNYLLRKYDEKFIKDLKNSRFC